MPPGRWSSRQLWLLRRGGCPLVEHVERPPWANTRSILPFIQTRSVRAPAHRHFLDGSAQGAQAGPVEQDGELQFRTRVGGREVEQPWTTLCQRCLQHRLPGAAPTAPPAHRDRLQRPHAVFTGGEHGLRGDRLPGTRCSNSWCTALPKSAPATPPMHRVPDGGLPRWLPTSALGITALALHAPSKSLPPPPPSSACDSSSAARVLQPQAMPASAAERGEAVPHRQRARPVRRQDRRSGAPGRGNRFAAP